MNFQLWTHRFLYYLGPPLCIKMMEKIESCQALALHLSGWPVVSKAIRSNSVQLQECGWGNGFRDLLQLVFTGFASFSYHLTWFWHEGQKARRKSGRCVCISHIGFFNIKTVLLTQTVTSERPGSCRCGSFSYHFPGVQLIGRPFRSLSVFGKCRTQLQRQLSWWYHTIPWGSSCC